MAIVRIGPKHQITIPKDAFDALALKPGDFLDVEVGDQALHLVPQKLIPRDQAWFWTPEWQAMEREADEAIAAGELSPRFSSAKDLIEYLENNEP